MPSEHERQTAFLRRCIRYDESATGPELDERIAQVQREDRCLRRASWLMAMVALLATAGIGYGAVLLEDFPRRLPAFITQSVMKTFCAVVAGSLICLLAFAGARFVRRRELNRRRDECRRIATRLLEAQFGASRAVRRNGDLQEREVIALRSRMSEAAPDAAELRKAL